MTGKRGPPGLREFKLPSSSLEAGERSLEGFVVNAIRYPEIAGTAEPASGHGQDIILLQFMDKIDIVFQR